jgi:hypothetical protein
MASLAKGGIGAALGSAMILFAVGVLALGFAFPRFVNDGVAGVMALSGLVRLVFWTQTRPKLLWPLIAGVGWIAIGVWAIFSSEGLAAISLALIIGFVGEGLLKAILMPTLCLSRGFLGWLVAADVAVGAALLFDWPYDTLWAIPVLIASNIALSGATLWVVGAHFEKFLEVGSMRSMQAG